MANYFRGSWIVTCLLSLVSAGCCCTQGMNTCSSHSACSSCSHGGGCGAGPLMGMASCRSGCGEVYVDEWVSEPPCVDDCGYTHSGCDSCHSKRPVRSLLRLLWGTPYEGGCSTGCDSGCEGGCSSCGGGDEMSFSGGSAASSSCNCGGSHAAPSVHLSPVPSHGMPGPMSPTIGSPVAPPPAAAAPTPAPVAPSSAKRLSPAQQRSSVARASTR